MGNFCAYSPHGIGKHGKVETGHTHAHPLGPREAAPDGPIHNI
jgi:hypothetical protein